MMRAFETVLLMTPKVAAPSVVAGLANVGWFQMLEHHAVLVAQIVVDAIGELVRVERRPELLDEVVQWTARIR